MELKTEDKIQFTQEQINQVNKVAEEIKEILPDYQAAMIKHGWITSLFQNKNFMEKIIKIEKSNTKEKALKLIDKEVFKFYDKQKMEKMTRVFSFSKVLSKRSYIVEDILWAHKKEKYTLTIPTLLAQVEGLIAEANEHNGQMNYDKMKKYLEELIVREEKTNYFGKYDSEIVKSFVENVLLVKFHHGGEIKSNLSRHAVLHGGDVSYWNKKNSLRLIMLIDYLQDVYSNFEEQLFMSSIRLEE